MNSPHLFELDNTHHLVQAKYSQTQSELEELNLPSEALADLSETESATDDRKLAELGRNPAIGPGELLMGVPEAAIINAAFCHPGPYGGRFNNSQRGAWYAGLKLETSVAEVVYHKRRFLRDMRFEGEETFEYQDFLADFAGMFYELDEKEQQSCMQPEPVPQCYAAGQALAAILLHGGVAGIVYPSARYSGATCIVCFRPALVFNPRRGEQYEITIPTEKQEVYFQVLQK